MLKLKKLWRSYTRGGLTGDASISEIRRVQFANIVSLIGMLATTLFGLIDISKYFWVGVVELTTAFAFLCAAISLRVFHDLRIAINLIIMTVLFLSIALLITGGGDGAGILWLAVFPPVMYFLAGRRASFIWSSLLISLVIVFFSTGLADPRYDIYMFQHSVFSLIVVSLVVYFYQSTNRQAQRALEQSRMELAESNAKLHRANEELNLANTAIEQKVVERTKALVDEHAKLASSVDSLPVGVILSGTKEIMKINQIGFEILSLDASPKKSYTSKVIFEELGIDKAVARSVKTRQQVVIDEQKYKSKLLRILIGPIISEGEESIGSVVVIEDITSLKALERSRDEFFLLASHELRTPLTVVEGNLSMMREQNKNRGSRKSALTEMLKDAYDASQRLSYIVNQLLEVAGYELGTLKLDKTEFDAVELAEDSAHKYGAAAKSKKLKLEFDAKKPVLVKADPAKTELVIDSLLDNAIRFTDSGKILVEAGERDGRFILTVSDSGSGLDKVAKANIFSTFQNNSGILMTRNSSQSTGLGLYVSKLRMEKMGGSIRLVKTTQGKGSTFEIELPLAK